MATCKQGPDAGWSWAIVFCCSYIHFALFGLFRSAGVMYVALLHNYSISREEASWPFSLCSAVFQLTGPLASVMTHFMPLRRACMLGSAIATIGVSCCYFAENIFWINIFYGVVHGLGFGLVVTLVPVIVNQYFVRHRATAIGIAFSGGTVSSFIFPVAMEFLLEIYGLRGSFLILGGVVMNTLVACSLLKPPPWLQETNGKASTNLADEQMSIEKDSGVSADLVYTEDTKKMAHNPNDSPNSKCPISHQCENVHMDRFKNSVRTTPRELEPLFEHDSSVVKKNTTDDSFQLTALDNKTGTNKDGVLTRTSNNHQVRQYTPKQCRNELNVLLVEEKQIVIVPKREDSVLDEDYSLTPKHSELVQAIIDILRHPMFHLLTFSMSVYFLGIHSFFMVIVDFAKDKGIPEAEAIYVLSVFSFTDLFGRVGLGWVTDRNFVKRKTMMMLNMAAIGILNQLYPLVDSLMGISVIAAFHGLAVGCSITLFFVLQAEYLGVKRLALVIGMTSFINGSMTFLRPGMIGLFRDVIGSYNWMFHFLGILMLAVVVCWLAEPWLASPNRRLPKGQRKIQAMKAKKGYDVAKKNTDTWRNPSKEVELFQCKNPLGIYRWKKTGTVSNGKPPIVGVCDS